MKKIVFHHIPKNAGTSVRAMVLGNNQKKENIFWHMSNPFEIKISVPDFFTFKDLASNSRSEIAADLLSESIKSTFSQKEFIGGHISYNDYMSLSSHFDNNDHSCHFFVIRDPFQRVVSYWEFCQAQDHHIHKSNLSFGEALEKNVRFFQGCTWEQNYYISGKNNFDLSRALIHDNNCMVVTTDFLSTLVSKIQEMLGLNNYDQNLNLKKKDTRLNVNPNTNYLDNYSTYRDKLKPLIKQDQLLFDYVKNSGGVINTLNNKVILSK
ncbi:MAG: sulfotransferase family 2 domain-containing protein [Colwellia sp.]|nr:sulfotransferase family 2 domain-containing protein [Colwellia sp.]